MSDYLALADQAHKLAKKGKTRFEIKDALGLRYVSEADNAIRAGERLEKIIGFALTPDEIKLLLALAKAERAALARGDLGSVKLKHITPWPWPRSKCERIARRRLDIDAAGEETLPPAFRRTGLGLLEAYHGGYVRMRPAGWAIVHTLETFGFES